LRTPIFADNRQLFADSTKFYFAIRHENSTVWLNNQRPFSRVHVCPQIFCPQILSANFFCPQISNSHLNKFYKLIFKIQQRYEQVNLCNKNIFNIIKFSQSQRGTTFALKSLMNFYQVHLNLTNKKVNMILLKLFKGRGILIIKFFLN